MNDVLSDFDGHMQLMKKVTRVYMGYDLRENNTYLANSASSEEVGHDFTITVVTW